MVPRTQLHCVWVIWTTGILIVSLLHQSEAIWKRFNVTSTDVFATSPGMPRERVLIAELRHWGLANRLRILSRLFLLAQATQRSLVIDWHASSECAARWQDLFQELPPYSGQESHGAYSFAGFRWHIPCLMRVKHDNEGKNSYDMRCNGNAHVWPETAAEEVNQPWLPSQPPLKQVHPVSADGNAASDITRYMWNAMWRHETMESCWLIHQQTGCGFQADVVAIDSSDALRLPFLTPTEEMRLRRRVVREWIWPNTLEMIRESSVFLAHAAADASPDSVEDNDFNRLARKPTPPIRRDLVAAASRESDPAHDWAVDSAPASPGTPQYEAYVARRRSILRFFPQSDHESIVRASKSHNNDTANPMGRQPFGQEAEMTAAIAAHLAGILRHTVSAPAFPVLSEPLCTGSILVTSNSLMAAENVVLAIYAQCGAIKGHWKGAVSAETMWKRLAAKASSSDLAKAVLMTPADTTISSTNRDTPNLLPRAQKDQVRRAFAEWWALGMAGSGLTGTRASSFIDEAALTQGCTAYAGTVLGYASLTYGAGSGSRLLPMEESVDWAVARAVFLTANRGHPVPEHIVDPDAVRSVVLPVPALDRYGPVSSAIAAEPSSAVEFVERFVGQRESSIRGFPTGFLVRSQHDE